MDETDTIVLQRWFLAWKSPLWSGVMALVVYGCLAQAHGGVFSLSEFPYYNYLADAFLHGQFYLRLLPSTTHDLVFFAQRYYLYWPPFPAFLMVPLVWMWGVHVSDIAVTVVLGALNVTLVALLLEMLRRKEVLVLADWQQAVLVAFFALGTVHITLAPLGRVWFTGQIVGFFFVALMYLAAVALTERWVFWGVGLALAAAAMTRNHLFFTAIWPVWYLSRRYRGRALRWWVFNGLKLVFPGAIGLAFLLFYNWVRFGSLLDVGLDYHQMATLFVDDYTRYGAFHWHYFPINFYFQYVFYPYPLRSTSLMGGSLFLLSPLFLGAFWGWREDSTSAWMLLLSCLFTSLPILFLMGTGWVQFGPRYSLDFTIPLLLLTAYGIRTWRKSVTLILMGISIVHYLGGVYVLSHILQ